MKWKKYRTFVGNLYPPHLVYMNQLPKTPRIEMVDALRGFAVMAILLVHNVEHFIFSVYPTDSPTWLAALDKGVFDAVFALFSGKAYAIFALLFGFTFYAQYANQQLKGKDFGGRFLWRMVLLALFATLNAAFFPGGDVLMLYAVMGISLFIVRKWSDRAVLVAAIVCLLQPVEWFHYVASLVSPTYQLPNLGVDALYAQVGEVTQSDMLWEFLWCNITTGQVASFLWAVGAGRATQTIGLFLLGLYLGRRQLFVSSDKHLRLWQTVLMVSAIAFCPLFSLRNLIMEGSAVVQQTAGTVFDMWQKLAFMLVLVASFVLLYQRDGFNARVANLRFYGRMSLSNYVSQSIIGALIYFPIGLYLAPYLGCTASLLVGILVFLCQVWFARWWFKSHKQGPLEGIWHKLTWI